MSVNIGFSLDIDDLNLDNPNDGIESIEIVDEAIAGNLYYNFHTNEFPSGEVRGQLTLYADNRDANGVGEVVFVSELNGEQEVQDVPVVTDAFGMATTTFTVAADGSVEYSVDVSLSDLSPDDLLPVDIGNGTLSPIHLHNAPAGANGPVIVDVFTDAGPEGIDPFEILANSITLENGDTVQIDESLVAPIGQPVVAINGDDARLVVSSDGEIAAPDADNSGVLNSGDDVDIVNQGEIFGAFNGIISEGNDFTLINSSGATISSDSRAVDITDGDNIGVFNGGNILGTDDQRNGTLYVDGTVDDLNIINGSSGVIDAGEGNSGDGVSVQVGEGDDLVSEDINIFNGGTIAGRGQAEFAAGEGRLTANGSSGVRFVNGADADQAIVTGSVVNTGSITAEVEVGFLGAVVIEDGVAFQGGVFNSGLISAPQNGLYVGDAEHQLEIFNDSSGRIESGSRAVNLDGDNVSLTNRGNILGTGDQRNGTVYVDGTGDNISINNLEGGVIDAGEGNIGDGVSVQVGEGDDLVSEDINIVNKGAIAGRGQAEFSAEEGRLAANGSSGVRFVNGSDADQAVVTGSIVNSGSITAEVEVGFLGGVVVEDGVSYQGQITNSGLISGPQNGLYLGNAEHQLEITNTGSGRIESGSRAVNLDGDNISFSNNGTVLGTGDQRNGTIYVDGTGDNISIDNRSSGVIDAGEGNSGSGVSVQVGAAAGLSDGSDDLETSVDIDNTGTIQGRGFGNVPAGVRLFVGSGLDASTFTGDITNQEDGVIASEQDAGILIEEGINFDGQITNEGTIRGGNGLAINAAGATGSVNVINGLRASLEGNVVLGEGNDTFDNQNSQDLNITGGGGNDLITGGSGLSTFDFDLGSGQDTITDFQVGQDVLELGAFFSDASQVLGATTQVGSDASISLSSDDSITLSNVDAETLTADHFTFA